MISALTFVYIVYYIYLLEYDKLKLHLLGEAHLVKNYVLNSVMEYFAENFFVCIHQENFSFLYLPCITAEGYRAL